jgi:hypothetical protein
MMAISTKAAKASKTSITIPIALSST